MTEDSALLRQYCERRSEGAFNQLVERHLNLVYSSALRRTDGDAHLAEDVAQTVFASLARSAALLRKDTVLSVWLYVAARNAAANAMRSERRRKVREQTAHSMHNLSSVTVSKANWDQLRPQLDRVVDELDEDDRAAVLLRFFDQRPFGEVGSILRISEDAARMRVQRALERMRSLLGRRGVTSTSSALAAMMADQAAQGAPVGLAASIVGASLAAGGSSVGASSFPGFLRFVKLAASLAVATGLLLYAFREEKKTPPEGASTFPRQAPPVQGIPVQVTSGAAETRAAEEQPVKPSTIDTVAAGPSVSGETTAPKDTSQAPGALSPMGSFLSYDPFMKRFNASRPGAMTQLTASEVVALKQAFDDMLDAFAALLASRAELVSSGDVASNEMALVFEIPAFPEETTAVTRVFWNSISASLRPEAVEALRSGADVNKWTDDLGGCRVDWKVTISRKMPLVAPQWVVALYNPFPPGPRKDAVMPTGQYVIQREARNPGSTGYSAFTAIGVPTADVIKLYGPMLKASNISLP